MDPQILEWIEKAKKDSTLEIESILTFLSNRKRWMAAMETLLQRQWVKKELPPQLDISISGNIRLSLVGEKAVEEYIKKSAVASDVIVIEKKKESKSIEKEDVMMNLKSERPLEPELRERKIKNLGYFKKFFRHKKRVSFTNPNFPHLRFDFTLVYESKTTEGEPRYEAELEFVKLKSSTVAKTVVQHAEEIMDVLRGRKKSSSASTSEESVRSSASEPPTWMLPNRKGFLDWIYRTFHMSRYQNQDDSFFPHQRFVRDYIHVETPYRGLLLYHGLGVGKTCASIAAAEGFLARHKKVIVMVPASLADNYRDEIMRCGTTGNAAEHTWNLVKIPRKASLQWMPYIPEGATISKEKQAFSKIPEADRAAALQNLRKYVDQHYHIINYNGITSERSKEYGPDFFENSLVIIDEAHNFISRVVNRSNIGKRVYDAMLEASGIRLILLSGTPIINHPYELGVLINLVRGPSTVYQSTLTSSATIPTTADIWESLGNLQKYIDHLQFYVENRTIEWTLLPKGYIRSYDGTVKKKEWDMDSVVERVCSHLEKKWSFAKKWSQTKQYALPIDRKSFTETFMDETDPDHPRVKNMDLFMRRVMGTTSYFRTAGEELFPSVQAKNIEKVPLADFQFNTYNKVRAEEIAMERRKQQMARMAIPGVFGAKGTVYCAFSRMACNFAFPDDLKRKFPKDLRKELLKNEIDIPEDEEEPTEEEKPKKKVDIDTQYEQSLKQLMETLQQRSREILTPSMLTSTYSPKMARILDTIEASPGKVLLYSQFRSIEGLGVMRLVLETAGFVQLRLEKKGGQWTIHDAEKILKPEYDGKRYVVFDSDREKTKLLLHLYNHEHTMLPADIQTQLQNRGNLRGELAKVIMITQSGAEGISLKHVRRVIIMEPFWNMVRMDQVIGRAVRTRSHIELPPDERNVEVFIFISVLTEKQLKQNFTLLRVDGGLTSDARIMQIAEIKDEIIQTFLNHLKSAAVDCRVHAFQNRILDQGLHCYSFPMPLNIEDEVYTPDLQKDKITSRMVRSRKIQGRVVSLHGKKYVLVDGYENKLFDYEAYKYAGVLTEVQLENIS